MRTTEELENCADVFNELIEHRENLKKQEQNHAGMRIIGRKHTCPRCGSVTALQTEAPYCSYCNWDSLDDQTNYQFS
jgi:ribosomal protein S27AE